MRTWTRATVDCQCGNCHPPRFLRVGDPMLVITIPPSRRRYIRCSHCEQAPPELPAVVVRHTAADETDLFKTAQDTFARIHRRHLLETMPLLVEREPGEEG